MLLDERLRRPVNSSQSVWIDVQKGHFRVVQHIRREDLTQGPISKLGAARSDQNNFHGNSILSNDSVSPHPIASSFQSVSSLNCDL